MTRLPSFKAYDIRGRVPDQLDAVLAGRIGAAMAGVLGPGPVVVGHDIRLSSPGLHGAVSDGLRSHDLLARIGGEEFLIALPATSLADAQIIAQGLCRAVDGCAVDLANGTKAEVTISIGMTTGGGGPADPVQISDLVAQAYRALMHSKTHGRNQVTIVRRAA